MNTPAIIIANTNQTELDTLARELQQEGYETTGAVSAGDLDKLIRGKKKYALFIIDVSGFDDGIWESCEYLHREKKPFIIIAPQRSPVTQRNSMKHGASGLLMKPLGAREMIEYIHTTLGD